MTNTCLYDGYFRIFPALVDSSRTIEGIAAHRFTNRAESAMWIVVVRPPRIVVDAAVVAFVGQELRDLHILLGIFRLR